MEEVRFVDRRNTGSVKWDMMERSYGRSDLLAMWLADMDFRAPDCVQEALARYMETGVYGYSFLGMEFLQAFVRWMGERHGFAVPQSWLRCMPGVIAGLNWAVQSFTEPGESVLILPPVYPQFSAAVRQNGRRLVESPLVRRENSYEMDFADMERRIREERVKLLLFCSPHNPVGRVWRGDELERLLALCGEHHVTIVSDEIHQDLTHNGNRQIPLCSLRGEGVAALTAPSKTFNLAGFETALAVIPDQALRGRWDAFTQTLHAGQGNTLGYVAGAAAYREGAAWNRAVCRQVYENYTALRGALLAEYPRLWIPELEGTYLMWIDFAAYLKKEEMKPFFQEECRLALNYGEPFGGGSGTCVRVNLATSPELVGECAGRILATMARREPET